MKAPRRLLFSLAGLLGYMLVPAVCSACEVCFGVAGDPATRGMNNAIFFLLGVIGMVQVGFVSLFLSFRRRGRALARAENDPDALSLDGGPS